MLFAFRTGRAVHSCTRRPYPRVYLNDVGGGGGSTRFGRLNLEVAPKKGQCLLFFPAAEDGTFDERTEHEGTEAEREKWICRIWRHVDRVPPPFGLPDGYVP